MDAYKSINLIVALVWLYFAFMASVFISFPLSSSSSASKNIVLDDVANQKVVLTEVQKQGKVLFKNNCASCHDRNMTTPLTGPALKGVADRWSDYPKTDLYAWIRNSAKLIDDKHPRAVEVASEWNYAPMSSMMHLDDKDIEALIAFIER